MITNYAGEFAQNAEADILRSMSLIFANII